MTHKEHSVQEAAIRHMAIGAGCAALNVCIMYLGTSVLHRSYFLAAASTFFITIPTAYFLIRRYVFQTCSPASIHEFSRFVSQQLVQFLTGIILLIAGVEALQLNPTASIAAATAILWVFAFLSQWIWVFRRTTALPTDTTESPKPLKVVVVTLFFPSHGGGLEKVAENLAVKLTRLGFFITWISSDIDKTPSTPSGNIEFVSAPTTNFVENLTQLPYPLWSPRILPSMWREIGNADIVHIHEHLYFPSLLAFLIARLRNRPVVITQHMGSLSLGSNLATIAYEAGARVLGFIVFPFVNQIVFISKNVMRFFGKDGSKNARLIFNGVDISVFHDIPTNERALMRGKLGLPIDKKIVLFVGRFVRKKGIHRIIALSKLFPTVTFVFVGSGPEAPNEAIGNVIVIGRVEHDRLVHYYQAADLFLLPSSGEGMPLVVQEALCCGTGVLSTDEVASACPESSHLIRTRPVPRSNDDIDGWQKALGDALDDIQYIEERAYRSDTARSLWSWNKCSSDYAALFHEISSDS